jgi:hypothetical protein
MSCHHSHATIPPLTNFTIISRNTHTSSWSTPYHDIIFVIIALLHMMTLLISITLPIAIIADIIDILITPLAIDIINIIIDITPLIDIHYIIDIDTLLIIDAITPLRH